MVWLRSCPKCRGDLFLTRDLDGPTVVCLQCGRPLRPDEEARLGPMVAGTQRAEAVGAGKEGRHHARVA